MLLQNEVVDGGDGVVAIICNVFNCLLLFTGLIIVYLANHFHVHWDGVLANVYSLVLSHFGLLVPRVIANFCNRQSLFGIGA